MASKACWGRNLVTAFATTTLALSVFTPTSLAYAVETAGNLASGGGAALVVVDEGFDPSAFSQAGFEWEALISTDEPVPVSEVEDEAASDIAEAATQGSAEARALIDENATSDDSDDAAASFDLAQSIASEATGQGTPAQTGTSYQKQASLRGIYLVTCSTLDTAQTVQRASALDGVLFAEADQVVAEGTSDTDSDNDNDAVPVEEGAPDSAVEPSESGEHDGQKTSDVNSADDSESDDSVNGADPASDDETNGGADSADSEQPGIDDPSADGTAPAERGDNTLENDPAESDEAPESQPAPLARSESADLTDLQWHLGTSGSMRNADDPADINIPDNLDGIVADGSDAPVIAVVDTGVDYTNPALESNMVDLSQYGTLMADTGCGVYGIDATQPAGSTAFADPMDTNSHGTHVAGIIAANGDVEGVNPNARIVAVRVIADSGSVYTSAIVRGIGWLNEAKAHGVNIQGFNFSIGGMTGVTYAARAAFALAEENGIVAFVAAGNNGNNVDGGDTVLTAVQAGSTVVVNSAEANGEPSYFSNYGKLSTDVFSPGSGIMATLPVAMATYYPAVAKHYGESLVYEGFERDGAAEDADVNGGFDFCEFDEDAEDGCGSPIESTGERFYLGTSSLPVVADEYRENVSDLGGGAVFSTYSRIGTVISKPTNLTQKDGWTDPATDEPLRFGLSGYSYFYAVGNLESANFQVTASFKLADGSWSEPMSVSNPESNGDEWLDLPGYAHASLTVPENADFESFQMKIEVSCMVITQETLPESVTVFIDSLGFGYGTHPYGIMSGTSMATPVAAGAFSLLRAAYPQESALRTSARIVGGAAADNRLTEMCSTGGRVDVERAATNPDPVVTSASFEDGILELEGWFLGGGAGTVQVGGKAAEVVSWTADTDTEKGIIRIKAPEGTTGSQTVTITRQDGASTWTSALITEKATDFNELPQPAFDEYGYVESASLAHIDGSIYLETQGLPEGTWILDYFRYSIADQTWEHLCSIDTGSKSFSEGSGLVAIGSQLYRYYNDPASMDMLTRGSLSLYRFDDETGAFETEPLALETTIGPASSVLAWGDRILVVAEGIDVSDDESHVVAVDPATGKVEELGMLPGGLLDASVSKDVLYLHIPSDPLDQSSLDKVIACPLDDFDAKRTIDLPAFDRSLPYSIVLAASNGDLAVLNMPGYPDELGGAYADIWTLDEGGDAAVPSTTMLQQGGSATATALVVGDTLYMWGISREVDTRTYFRSIPLSTLGMEAEPTSIDPKPEAVPADPQKPATLDKLASTGDDSAIWMIVGAIVVSGTFIAACGAYGAQRQRRNRRQLR